MSSRTSEILFLTCLSIGKNQRCHFYGFLVSKINFCTSTLLSVGSLCPICYQYPEKPQEFSLSETAIPLPHSVDVD